MDGLVTTLEPVRRRVSLATMARITRNQLASMPKEVFHAPIVRTAVFGQDRYHVTDPALIGEALVGQAVKLRRAPEMRHALVPLLGEGLLTAEDSNWRWQRRALAPGFAPARLQGMAPTMLDAAARARDRMLAAPGRPVRIAHEMMRTTFDIVIETMFATAPSLDVARIERSIAAYAQPLGWVLAYSLAKAPDWAPYPGRRGQAEAAAYLRSTLRSVLDDRRANPGARDDLVTLLLAATDPQDGRRMTDEEMIDNLLTFVTAGHETTSLGLAWTFYLLAHHPAVEARLLAEIDAVTGGAPVQPEHLGRLAYTRQVFNEAMRLYPPAPLISRRVAEPFTLGGVAIPSDAMLVIPIYAVHRKPDLWPDPERFDPDRFSEEASAARSRYAHMPFGGGPRVCIGGGFAMLEAVAILAVLLQRLRLADAARHSPVPVMKVTLRPRPDPELRPLVREIA